MRQFSRDIQEGNSLPDLKDVRYVWPGVTLTILFAVMAFLLSSCATTPVVASPGSTTEPSPSASPITITEAPTAEPITERTLCSGKAGKYTCYWLPDRPITLKNVPTGAAPYLLPIADEAALREAPKEKGIGCIFVVVGDLAFYDKSDKLVTKGFSSSVSYTLTEEDKAACSEYIEALIAEKSVKATDIDFIPVYFADGMWKAFNEDEYDIVIDGDMVTVTFTTWGDQPMGGGTRP